MAYGWKDRVTASCLLPAATKPLTPQL